MLNHVKHKRKILNLAYLLALATPLLWMKNTRASQEQMLSIAFRENPKGWEFDRNTVQPATMRELKTTNIISGVFRREDGNRVTVFIATWPSAAGVDLDVLNHSPAICWVAAGWKIADTLIEFGEKKRISGLEFPVEIAEFLSPNGNNRELAIWCAFVDGFPYSNKVPNPFFEQNGKTIEDGIQAEIRNSNVGYFFAALQNRTMANGQKQFIRFSTEQRALPVESYTLLESFIEECIVVTQNKKADFQANSNRSQKPSKTTSRLN